MKWLARIPTLVDTSVWTLPSETPDKCARSRYDYKIQYNDISKLFLLEKPDERYVAFVVSLDKPIRQGQQKYQHLVLRTTKVGYPYNMVV